MSLGANPAITERNIFSHRATPVVNKHLPPAYLSSWGKETVWISGIFGNAGPAAPGKAPQSLCFCLGGGVIPGNSCYVSTETEATGKGIKALHRPLWQSWVPGIWSWRQLVPVRIPADSSAAGAKQREGQRPACDLWWSWFCCIGLVLVKDVLRQSYVKRLHWLTINLHFCL